MPAVSNTSPILGLAAINRLELLQKQFENILIPPAVVQELKLDTEFTGTASIRQAIKEEWIRVQTPENIHLIASLRLDLDWGEAEAIALALDKGISAIIMDERDGRTTAKAMGLSPVGVIGILLRAKKLGDVNSVSQALQALKKNVGFFISKSFEEEVLKEAGEFS